MGLKDGGKVPLGSGSARESGGDFKRRKRKRRRQVRLVLMVVVVEAC